MSPFKQDITSSSGARASADTAMTTKIRYLIFSVYVNSLISYIIVRVNGVILNGRRELGESRGTESVNNLSRVSADWILSLHRNENVITLKRFPRDWPIARRINRWLKDFLSIGLDPLNIEAGIKVIHVPCEVFGCLWFWITLLPNDVSEYIMHIYNKTSNMRRTLVDNTFWSLRCSWSIACWCCSNYILILDLTPCFNGSGKVNCKTRRETFKLCD